MTPDISRPIHLFGHYSVLGPVAMVLRFLYFDRFGSFATELVKVDAGTCPLRSESDRNIAVPRMNAIAKSGPSTPASGCISCRGYQASDFNH
jgi:hypothetical protein